MIHMTSEVRSKSRKDKIIKTLSVGTYAKVVGVVVSFAIVPLAVGYLGVEGYGLWIAVSSLVAMLSFVDGGAGNALVNMVSHATGKDSKQSIKGIVSSGFFVLLIIAVFGALLFSLLHTYVPWAWVFGLSESANTHDLEMLVLIVGFAFFLGMPISVVGNVQRGFQEGNIEVFWNAKGRLLTLLFVYISIQADLGLLGVACAFVAGPIVASMANNFYYFGLKKREVAPSLNHLNSTDVKAVLGTGGLFFVLQITSAIQMQGDNIIIANMLGPSSVSQYAICMQLFMAVPMFMALLWTPLWPAYREALASGDADWVRRVFIKSLKLALLVGIPTAGVLVVFGDYIIRLWVGDEVVPSMLLLVGCGIWMLILLVGNVLAVFLNAMQVVKAQIYIAIAAGIVNVIVSIFLIQIYGVAGAIYGSIIAYILCAIVPFTFLIPKLLKHLCENRLLVDLK